MTVIRLVRWDMLAKMWSDKVSEVGHVGQDVGETDDELS